MVIEESYAEIVALDLIVFSIFYDFFKIANKCFSTNFVLNLYGDTKMNQTSCLN